MHVRVVAFLLCAVLFFLMTGCGGNERASRDAFVGTWDGHTRRLVISADGRGREIVDSGCCTRVVTARFRLLNVRGTPTNAVATIRFTFVQINRGIFAETHRTPPTAGQVAALHLRRGVVKDEATTVTFCAADVDKCGL